MMLRNMQKTIVKAIPSPELRREIELWNYRFSETDLLKIAYNCAPSFGRMIQLFELVSREAAKPAADYANQLIRWQYAVRSEFCREDEDTVYELSVRISPKEEEHFACKTTAQLRARQTDCLAKTTEPERAYCTVIKRSIRSDCECGMAELLPNGMFKSIAADVPCPTDGELDLDGGFGTLFPQHIADRGLVRYTSGGFEHLGIHRLWTPGQLLEAMYVIPLESDMMRLHDYEREFSDHEHIYPPFAFSADIAELNDRQKADYFAYLEYLDE